LIRTIAGRGYQFTGEIRTVSASPDARPVATAAVPISASAQTPTNLPEPISELIGRDVELDEIPDISASHRLVTLTGAGGIGKTRLGFEAARRLLPRFADGFGSSSWRRCPIPSSCRSPSRPCSGSSLLRAWQRRSPSRPRCVRSSSCWCWTIANMWSTPRRGWSSRCCAPTRQPA